MGTQQQIVRQNGAVTVREDFGGTEIQPHSETASTAIASREKAIIEAQYIVAMKRPRNIETVRVKMLKECLRPGFAEVARYRKPVGNKKQGNDWVPQFAEGFSIRFAEMAIRHMGNIRADALPIYDDEAQRIVMLSVTDLESNSTYNKPITITKQVERKSLKKGQVAISQRMNSQGETTYLVSATDDETSMKEASAWSKFVRNALRFVPGDILDECESKIHETLQKSDQENPDAAKRRLIDAFDVLGVSPSDLQQYIGHPLDRLQPAEVKDLRTIYSAIKDGETTWQTVMEAADPAGTVEAAQEVAERKLAAMRTAKQAEKPVITQADVERELAKKKAGEQPDGTFATASDSKEPSEDDMREWQAAEDAKRSAAPSEKPKLSFGGKKQ